MLSTDLTLLLAAAAIIFAAAFVSSIAGFAFSALASAPLLRLLDDPVRAVTLMVVCSIAMQLYGVWALRASIDWRALRPFLAGGALTVPIGVWLLARTSPELFALSLGAFLIGYGGYMMFRGKPPVVSAGTRADALAGALGGVAGGLAGFPGSFVTIWCGMRGWSKERQRAVYQPYILVMQLEALALLQCEAPGALSLEVMLFVPLSVAAAFAGLALFKRISAGQFNRMVFTLLVASGAALAGGALA